VLITGGAGFIGTNVAERLLAAGRRVVVLDNLSRAGVDQNAMWLQRRYGRQLKVIVGDVRDPEDLRRALEDVEHVFHFAAQVAVTSSLLDPRSDYEINATGTLNLLEAMRALDRPPSLIYTSTNKVYGSLEDLALRRDEDRWVPADRSVADRGIPETRPLAFETPYGCSKGAAEQYVLDYSRSFDLDAVVFRMSCIYGPHQFGTEDQGWVAHFLRQALEGRSITLYGDGFQVRDILNVRDLVEAFLVAGEKVGALSGQAFNIGGGNRFAVSLLEVVDLINALTGRPPTLHFDSARKGDQRYFVSDTSKFQAATGWKPQVTPRAGIRLLYEWLLSAHSIETQEIAAS
jgi:CDP-paratose 2-epimerase